MKEPLVLKPGQGTNLKLGDVELTLKATSSDTDGTYSLIEGVWQPSGFGPLPHLHKEFGESFYVLDGQFDFVLGDEKLTVDAGAFIVVPPGVMHWFGAVNGPARLMFMHTPPLEGFFVELEELSRAGPPDPSRQAELMTKWGMEVRR